MLSRGVGRGSGESRLTVDSLQSTVEGEGRKQKRGRRVPFRTVIEQGRGSSRTPSITLNIAVFAPIASATVTAAMIVKPGFFALLPLGYQEEDTLLLLVVTRRARRECELAGKL
jgi:hypothetical protein